MEKVQLAAADPNPDPNPDPYPSPNPSPNPNPNLYPNPNPNPSPSPNPNPNPNQVEAHPGWRNDALLAFCRRAGVHVTAYAPLGRGAVLAVEGKPTAARGGGGDMAANPSAPCCLLAEVAVVEAAARLGCTPAQARR